MKTMFRPLVLGVVSAVAIGVGSSAAESDPTPSPLRRIEVGEVAPGFELDSLDGERFDPQSLRGEAPLVLVFFRGTW